MKNAILTLSIGLAVACSSMAQSEQAVNDLYHQHSDNVDCFNLSFSKELLDAIDIDVDWDDYTQNVKGDFENVKIIIYDNYKEGRSHLSSIRQIISSWGYYEVDLPDSDLDNRDDLKLMVKKQNGHYRNVFLLLNNRDDEKAVFIAFTGKLHVVNV